MKEKMKMGALGSGVALDPTGEHAQSNCIHMEYCKSVDAMNSTHLRAESCQATSLWLEA